MMQSGQCLHVVNFSFYIIIAGYVLKMLHYRETKEAAHANSSTTKQHYNCLFYCYYILLKQDLQLHISDIRISYWQHVVSTSYKLGHLLDA